jgi:putative DNA primase/helicase
MQELLAAKGRKVMSASLDRLDETALIDRIARVSTWGNYNQEGEWVPMAPSSDAAAFLLRRAGEWRLLPIDGLLTPPTIRPDGTIFSAPSYDPETRLYMKLPEGFLMPDVPDVPTRADAETALKLLKDLLVKFPFVTDTDWSVALSMLITAMVSCARPAPLHLMNAPTPGTGKSMLVDVAAAIATGQQCPVSSAAEDDAETEKRLVGAVIDGYPIISIDNVSKELGGDFLCQATERTLVRVRKFGKLDNFDIQIKSFLVGTGNNARVKDDMVRRTFPSDCYNGNISPNQRWNKSIKRTHVRVWRDEWRSEVRLETDPPNTQTHRHTGDNPGGRISL